ncbi:MAG TPA: formate dehydrogenase accessory sulfurtransferase FdhD [Methanomicrobiales archaeon]|jgi:FdhD protein|nr:formate dehydrogenase accessory sulfurtransferase FdhD [Methanomicrobiales archaeon]
MHTHPERPGTGKGLPVPPVTQDYDIIDIDGENIAETRADVCVEESVNLLVNGTRLASLTITPRDLEAFAYGYLVCEGIVPGMGSIDEVRIEYPDILTTVSSISPGVTPEATEIRSSGCVGIRKTWASLTEPLGEGITIDLPTLFQGMQRMNEYAPLWKVTGGTHCSIILDARGRVVSAIEDIGRHNSVDKAVGRALLDGVDLSRCFMVLTGRLAAGMVAKVYRAGITILASNTAPFSTGICLARQVNMTLAGFTRPPRITLYSCPGRILLPGDS